MKKLWRKLKRWYLMAFKGYYDPFFETTDGVHYMRMSDGVIVRLEGKKRAKRQKKIKELKEFFK